MSGWCDSESVFVNHTLAVLHMLHSHSPMKIRHSLLTPSLVAAALLAPISCGENSSDDPSGAGGQGPAGGTEGNTGGTLAAAGGTLTSGGSNSGGGATEASGGAPQNTGGDGPASGGFGGEANGGSDGAGGDGSSWDGCDSFELPDDCTIPEGAVLPGEVRCTGLYSDFESRTLRCGVRPYTPTYALWTDGARKQRYVWLPPGESVDASSPDGFIYPVGTRFWKEFYVGPEGAQTLGETRYLIKTEAGWLYTVYVWSEDGQTALQENDGVDDLFGTGHSVPTRDQCKICHEGREDLVLGWDFIMLAPGASDLTAQDLFDEGLLTGVDESHLSLTLPGDEVEQAALGYLHANCGISCHNTTTFAAANPSGLYLRLNVGEMDTPHTTAAVLSGINREPSSNADFGQLPEPDLDYFDFRPLDPDRSLAFARMNYRGSDSAMPPLGTHVIDPEGISVIRAWIESMTEERGYPAPAP
jgi:hypothetical protein